METKNYKTIRNGQAIMMNNWNIDRRSERASVRDMGMDEFYKDRISDEERVYGAVRGISLYGPGLEGLYEIEDKKYENPLILAPGEIVRLESNNKLYKVVPVRPKWEYIGDIIHFELVK